MLASVSLPLGMNPVPADALQLVDAETAALSVALQGRRQIEFLGGRLAYQAAMRALNKDAPCLKTGEHREPLGPTGLSISISHKEDIAFCLVADAALGCVGIDLEGDGRNRIAIARRILRPEEMSLMALLPDAEQWPRVLLTFAIKEAAYKAMHPHLKRFVGFEEARVTFDAASVPNIELFSKEDEPALTFEVDVETQGEQRVLVMVRAREHHSW